MSVCGSNLSHTNEGVARTFPLFAGAFASMDEYICIIITGQWDVLVSCRSGTYWCPIGLSIGVMQIQVVGDNTIDFMDMV